MIDKFFIIAGIIVTILGIIAISLIVGVFIAVKFFGVEISLKYLNEENNNEES